jgi:hypothetical protein
MPTAKQLYICVFILRSGTSHFCPITRRDWETVGNIRYMSYIWHASVGLHIDALKVLGDGVKANPTRSALCDS